MPSEKLPPHVVALLKEFSKKRPYPTYGKAAMRLWMYAFVQELNYRYPNEGWGMKKSADGHDPSADVLARMGPDGRLVGWDLLIGVGSGDPKANFDNPAFHNLDGQVFISVAGASTINDGDGGGTNAGGYTSGKGMSDEQIAQAVAFHVDRVVGAVESEIVTGDVRGHVKRAALVTARFALGIARRNPPTSRRGSGRDGGITVQTGVDVELDPA